MQLSVFNVLTTHSSTITTHSFHFFTSAFALLLHAPLSSALLSSPFYSSLPLLPSLPHCFTLPCPSPLTFYCPFLHPLQFHLLPPLLAIPSPPHLSFLLPSPPLLPSCHLLPSFASSSLFTSLFSAPPSSTPLHRVISLKVHVHVKPFLPGQHGTGGAHNLEMPVKLRNMYIVYRHVPGICY